MTTKTCKVDNCNSPVKSNGMCNAHRIRWARYGRTHSVIGAKGSGTVSSNGYRKIGKKYQHVIVAESALGKELPEGAVVHHIDGDRLNNSNSNLVICENNAYHRLIHAREDAMNRKSGVHWSKQNKKWVAQVTVDGKTIHLGSFAKKDDAYDARIKAFGMEVNSK